MSRLLSMPVTTATDTRALPDSEFLRGLALAVAVGVVLWAILITLAVFAAYEAATA
jgi:hypothetical protein